MAVDVVSSALKNGLYTRIVGRRILSYDKLASTMDEAVNEAEQGSIEGTVIVASTQTAGRGRFHRPWVSLPGNLLLSVIFYPTTDVMQYLSIIASLAATRSIENETGLRPSIKWPNDVLIRGKKVCGLLVENALEGDVVKHAIVGFGLNVSLDPRMFPEIASIATSLNLEAKQELDASRVLRSLLHELDDLYLALGRGQHPIKEWKERLETLGERVEIRWNNEVIVGYAEDVDSNGHLMLKLDDGTKLTVPAGEVSLRSAAKD